MEALQQTTEEKGYGFDLKEKDIIYSLYDARERLYGLKFGKKTRKVFPGIDDSRKAAERKMVSKAALHEMERRLGKNLIANGDPLLREVAMARRTQGPINIEELLDHGSSFGNRPKPVFDLIREEIAEKQMTSNQK